MTNTAAAGPSLIRFHNRLHRTIHWQDIFLMQPEDGQDAFVLMVRKANGAFKIAAYNHSQSTEAELDRQELEAAWQVSLWMKPSLLHDSEAMDDDLVQLADDLMVEVDAE